MQKNKQLIFHDSIYIFENVISCPKSKFYFRIWVQMHILAYKLHVWEFILKCFLYLKILYHIRIQVSYAKQQLSITIWPKVGGISRAHIATKMWKIHMEPSAALNTGHSKKCLSHGNFLIYFLYAFFISLKWIWFLLQAFFKIAKTYIIISSSFI